MALFVGLITVLILSLSQIVIAAKGRNRIGCRNQDGKPVDWFIGYKLPRQNSKSDVQIKRGYAYLYMDEGTSGRWVRSKAGIDTERQSVAYTLRQVYSNMNRNNVFRLLYNDELPQGNVSFTKGHAKGALVFNSKSGFWLVHSVPRFPPKGHYAYPPTGAKFGQSFFCITFHYNALKEIADQLYLYNPYIYDWSLPATIAAEIEVLEKVISGDTQKKEPYNRTTALVSDGGISLTSFAKFKKWGKDLYGDLVAPTVRKDLFTETWQIGRGDLGPSCVAPYKIYDIKNLTLEPGVKFSNHQDHAKWAVSSETSRKRDTSNGYWICIGDINRQKEQLNRSGGTMCMRNEKVWKAFRDSINDYARCPV